VNVSIGEVDRNAKIVRQILGSFPEVRTVATQIGRPDDGTDPTGYFELQCFVPLKGHDDWPVRKGTGRQRTKADLVYEMNAELSRQVVGVDWDFSQIIRDNVMESLSGVKGENSIKISGPKIDELEDIAQQFYTVLAGVRGVSDPGIFRITGQTNLSFPIDRAKCAQWGVSVDDVEDVIETAVGGMRFSEMIEGERRFDISLRWPTDLRSSADEILEIPVDVVHNVVTQGASAGLPQTPISSATQGISPVGTSLSMPALTGSAYSGPLNDISRVPRRRLRDLVTPQDEHGQQDQYGSFVRPGAATISREQGNRIIAVKFSVRDRDLAGTVAEAKAKTADLLKDKPQYRVTWSGEFQQMQEAELRMAAVLALALLLILVMLYLAFYSLLDALLVYTNVLAMSLGGVWALIITGLNFNVSAAVGFISILGVAVMNGLLMVSSFNHQRSVGTPVRDAIMRGTERLVRPVTMTALAAILGLLPAAFSTQIGSESQKPLAIVVVGGMIGTLIFFNLVPLLYSFYGHREPRKGGSAHVH
jgi:cobalt-zinc-cadmium resistance protein CzcA